MGKPMAGITSRDGHERIGPGEFEGLARPRRAGAEDRFHFAPAQLDGGQIGRIRGQVMQRGLRRFNSFANPHHFMRFEVIPEDDIPWTQVGNEDLVAGAAKDLTVRAPSTVIVATRPLMPSAPISVTARPRWRGLVAWARCPRGAHA